MAVDPLIERTLEQFGFAEVLVSVRPAGGAAAAASAASASAVVAEAVIADVLRHFLPQVPVAAGGMVAAAATASLADGASPSTPPAPAARFFPRLGVAVGYVERDGVEALTNDPAIEEIVYADQPSLIRPV